jgi:hypothetical protein
MIEDFFHLPPVSLTPVAALNCENLREFATAFATGVVDTGGKP